MHVGRVTSASLPLQARAEVSAATTESSLSLSSIIHPFPQHATAITMSSGKPDKLDPVVRNALRYTLSAREYKLLHQHLISRAPAARQRAPPPRRYEAIVRASDDYNAAAVRASLRLGISTYAALKLWESISTRFLSKRTATR